MGKAGNQYIDETTKLMNEMVARITLEGYSIQSYNDNAESPTAETFKKLKSQRSFEGFRKTS